MSTYKNIIGKPVKFLSSNLDNAQGGGQIWYNSTDKNFKNMPALKAWSSGGNLITARSDFRGTFGTQTAFKGFLHPDLAKQILVRIYIIIVL